MTGDGLLATFDGPARAVTCAAAIGRELRTLGLAVRAAVHTGEVELRGGDVGGIAVHIASRVMGLARPNEVLVSSTVKDLVAGAEIRFEDRGVQSLPGGARPVAAVHRVPLTKFLPQRRFRDAHAQARRRRSGRPRPGRPPGPPLSPLRP
jgi:class 3 adenylate cyclase